MTHEQYARWKDFALRMARTLFPETVPDEPLAGPTRDWVVAEVEDFFSGCIEDGDGEPYEWVYRIEAWCHTADMIGPKQDPNGWRSGADCSLVCDEVTEFLENENPHVWCGWTSCEECEEQEGCEMRPLLHDQTAARWWDDVWGGAVRCCIRAGLDMAVEESAGVVGYTAGDIRRMYPEGVPDWLADGWDGDFASFPDDEYVWL